MNRLGGGWRNTPLLKKAVENRYRVEMHVHTPFYQCQLIEEKNQTDILKSLGARKGTKKCQKQVQENVKIIFFCDKQINLLPLCTLPPYTIKKLQKMLNIFIHQK